MHLFRHYLKLALRNLLDSKVLTALIVLAIGLGIGASMTMITVLHVMSGDPIPARSAKLFYPHLDIGPVNADFDFGRAFTWSDANNLLHAHRAVRQAMMAGGRVVISPGGQVKPFFSSGRYASSEFFAMFDAPFAAGSHWTAKADTDRARVVVLNSELAQRLFGSAAAAVGQPLRIQDREFRVVGVLNDWHPVPLFYSASGGAYAFKSEDHFFLPLATAMDLKLRPSGEACWGDGGYTGDHCTWVQFWVELDTPAQIDAYRRFLVGYWRDQKMHGRFPRNLPPSLQGLMQRLRLKHLVPSQVTLQLWLALGFLGVCLFNTIGLMLAKFLRRAGEVGVRRALGARQRDIFAQLGVEAGILGLAGGVLGLLLTWFGLWLVRQRPDAYAQLAHLDLTMVLGVFVLAVVTSVLAGLLPAWRACRIPPALQLKIQ
ncbi:MAG TPA: ABC transporter permease [Rhodanobacteraceae bacterium]|nr:ABC transporter permease [Rhodanobacteraceae bacterium]